MYQVVTDDEVNAQVGALPDEMLPYYAQVLVLLELAPLEQRALHRRQARWRHAPPGVRSARTHHPSDLPDLGSRATRRDSARALAALIEACRSSGPDGTEHRPRSVDGAVVPAIEPAATLSTGDRAGPVPGHITATTGLLPTVLAARPAAYGGAISGKRGDFPGAGIGDGQVQRCDVDTP